MVAEATPGWKQEWPVSTTWPLDWPAHFLAGPALADCLPAEERHTPITSWEIDQSLGSRQELLPKLTVEGMLTNTQGIHPSNKLSFTQIMGAARLW